MSEAEDAKEKAFALHKAIEYECVDKVQVLIPLSKNVNGKNEKGYTPILLAAEKNNSEILHLLLNHDKINVEVADADGYTVLHCLALRGNFAVIERILEKFPKTHIDREAVTTMDTPLLLAAKKGYTDVAGFLLQRGARVNHHNKKGHTALHYAANSSHSSTVTKLLDWGADVNARNAFDQTPLMKASQWGYVDCSRILLAHGADVDAACNFEKTALLYATQRKNVEVARLLLENGADVNHVGFEQKVHKRTPLGNACYHGITEMVELLLSHAADVNYPGQYSFALFKCATGGNLTSAQILLAAGANVSGRKRNGESAADEAEKYGYAELAVFLRRQHQ